MTQSAPLRDQIAGARAFWTVAAGQGEVRPVQVQEPGDGDVLVRAVASAISRGTETLVFRGAVPPSEYDRMRCPHQDGAFPFPVKYGYSMVGEILAGPGVGRRVFCLHPHQSVFCVPQGSVIDVPDGVPSSRAVLAANLETAINGIWDARLAAGDRVVIIGAGVIGCLLAIIASRTPGCEVQLVDLDPRKRAVAEALPVAFAGPGGVWSDADAVFNASASGPGLQQAIDAAGNEAAVVEMSWYGDKSVTLELGAGFHSRRLQIRSSQVGSIPAFQQARWDYGRRLRLALRLLGDASLAPAFDQLLTGESSFDELPDVMARLADPKQLVLCHRVRYD